MDWRPTYFNMSFPLKRSRSFKKIPTDGRFKRRTTSVARQRATRTAVSSQRRVSNFIARDIPSSLHSFSGIARKRTALLKYATEVTITGAPGANASHVFRLNSIFDPDFTGIGHQPLAHDQWALLYGRYTVVKATIKATPIRDSNTNVIPGLLRVGVQRDASVSSVPMTIAENTRYTDWVHSGLLGGGNSAGGARGDTVKQEIDMAKFFEVKDLMDGTQDTYGAEFGVNPDAGAFGVVIVSAVGGNTPGPNNYLVELEMEVVFTKPNSLTQS